MTNESACPATKTLLFYIYLFRSEADIKKLWIPQDSPYIMSQKWKKEHFENTQREHYGLISHKEDILSQEGLLKVGWTNSSVYDVVYLNHCMTPYKDLG